MLRHVGGKMATKSAKMSQHRRQGANPRRFEGSAETRDGRHHLSLNLRLIKDNLKTSKRQLHSLVPKGPADFPSGHFIFDVSYPIIYKCFKMQTNRKRNYLRSQGPPGTLSPEDPQTMFTELQHQISRKCWASENTQNQRIRNLKVYSEICEYRFIKSLQRIDG